MPPPVARTDYPRVLFSQFPFPFLNEAAGKCAITQSVGLMPVMPVTESERPPVMRYNRQSAAAAALAGANLIVTTPTQPPLTLFSAYFYFFFVVCCV